MMSPIGRYLGPYLVVAPLGRDGFGDTFSAERRGASGAKQRVCLKRLRREGSGASRVDRFEREADVIATLQHPNVVSLVDFGREGDAWWMALTLVDGVDLRAILDDLERSDARFPLSAALMVVTEIAKALAHAHAHRFDPRSEWGVVHGDVSPGNILVSVDGEIQLTNFGLAKGQPQYMAPEQTLGEAVDGRADLFSLGVVLFELLAERRPFDGPTPLAAQLNAVQGVRPRLERLVPGLPPALVTIVDRLLEPRREDRYATARDLVDALSALSIPANAVFRLGELARRTRADDDARENRATIPRR